MLGGHRGSEFRETQSKRREDEEREDGGGEQSAYDDDSHGAFDFLTGCVGMEGEREQGEAGDQGRH